MPRKILIVDDNAINRQLLQHTLSADYGVIEAENGREALSLLRENHGQLSAVLLDIVMPEMDGYEVLRQIRDDVRLAQIPVIVVTGSEDEASRVKALSLGANDFILKPFNPDIVRHCLKNNIALRETASILSAIQKDKLTGLYNREAFFEKVNAQVQEKEAGYYILSCFDIDNFKLINDQYGSAEGDRILREIGKAVGEDMESVGGVGGRISADNFAVLLPYKSRELSITRLIQQNRMAFSDKQAIVFSVGRYVISDLTLPASALYDRAYIAKQSVKGRYDEHLAYFDDAMLQKLVREQQITGEMEIALREEQFEAWFQPQYNHATGALLGAEALARWRHPRKGIIPPGEFIPLFEQNGFIYELDKYVWRDACRHLRAWIDRGLTPLPISVNISRYDIFRADLIEVLGALVKEFDLPVELLRLEITESAFTNSSAGIVAIIKQLIALGFTVEIDDFGSGYSSLNTLKDVPAQVVKLDMRFLDGGDDARRGGNILESIVRMAKWLGMTVLAEGVEELDQADFLKSIGCNFVQGYLYARPMPAAAYEALLEKAAGETHPISRDTDTDVFGDAFWDPQSLDSLIFSKYAGGACVYEFHNGRIELIRVTDQYIRAVFGAGMTAGDAMKIDWVRHTAPESVQALQEAVHESVRTHEEVGGEYLFLDLPGCGHETALYSTLRVVASADDRHLIYCTSVNITAQRQAQRGLLDDLPGGVLVYEYDGKECAGFWLNKRAWALLGRAPEGCGDAPLLSFVYPADRSLLRRETDAAIRQKRDVSCDVRVLNGEGVYLPLRIVGHVMPRGAGRCTVSAVLTLVSDETVSVQEMLPAALQAVMDASSEISYVKGKDLRYVRCSRRFALLAGYAGEQEMIGKTSADVFPPELAAEYDAIDREVLESGRSFVDFNAVFPTRDGERKLQFSKYPLLDAQGGVLGVYGSGRDVTELRNTESRLALLTNSIPGGIAIYEGTPDALDKIHLSYFSDGFCRLFGYSREEYEKRAVENPLGLVFSEDVSGMFQRVTALVRDGVPLDYIYRAKVGGGGKKWINVRAVMGEPNGDKLTVNAVFFDVTEQKDALEKLRVSEAVNRLAMEQSKNVVCRYDVAARRLYTSPNADPIFEPLPVEEDVPHKMIREGKISPDTADSYMALFESILRGEKSGEALYQRKSTRGWRWIELHFTTIFSDSGEPVTAVMTYADVSESIEKDAAYKKWRQSFHDRKPESYSLYHCNISKNTVVDATEGLLIPTELHRVSTHLDERTESYVQQCVFDDDRELFLEAIDRKNQLFNFNQGKRTYSVEYREEKPQGGTRWLRLTVDLVESPYSSDVEAYLLFENIDEAKRAELEIRERAETDPLTGVLNRSTFAQRVEQIIAGSRPSARHALLMMDLDGFKLVNDVFGHGAGDQALIDIAGLLRRGSRRDDLVGRLGGDEFVIFLSDIPGELTAAKKARQFCEQTCKTLSAEVRISGSIGIALYPQDGNGFESLYKRADETLYYVKGTGKNGYAFYHAGMTAKVNGADDAGETKGSGSVSDYRKRRMLIVDDSPVDCELLANMFRDEFKIETANDGAAALAKLHHYGTAVSVVLLDLMMPGLDGFAVLEKLRQSADIRSIPVVVVSVSEEREIGLKAIRSGAADFVAKPVDPDILRVRVHSAVSKAENERLRAQNSFLALQSSELESYELALERSGTLVVVHDWVKGRYSYSAALTRALAGRYDNRPLWHILLSDMVAESETVQRMQQLEHDVANDRSRMDARLTVRLKTAAGDRRLYEMSLFKQVDDYGLADKILMVFRESAAKKNSGLSGLPM